MLVIMNTDGAAAVAVDARLGATVPALGGLAWGVLGVVLILRYRRPGIALAVRRRRPAGAYGVAAPVDGGAAARDTAGRGARRTRAGRPPVPPVAPPAGPTVLSRRRRRSADRSRPGPTPWRAEWGAASTPSSRRVMRGP